MVYAISISKAETGGHPMKGKIVQAATAEIRQWGLKFSIRDLARKTGISTKTIYGHFGSKEDIIGYIVDEALQEMRQQEQKLQDNSSLSFKQRLKQALIIVPSGFALVDLRILNELKLLYPGQWAKVDSYLNEGWDYIRGLFSAGMASGELRHFDVELFIRVYVAAWYTVMERQAEGGFAAPSLAEGLQEVVEFMLYGIYAPKGEE
jgi:AcrR family transcriptional regulator